MKKYIALLLVMNSYLSKAQNNAIFNGGSADGFDRKGFAQAGNNIFTGGNGDGWVYNASAQASANIFAGGSGDGWNSSFFLQAGNAIFKGGEGDGWSSANFLQAGNGIFNGGSGDGWSYSNFLQAGNSIFSGGAGDGWASVYRNLGPLPVNLLWFTAEKKGLTASLSWQTAREDGASYFEVQRSADAVSFDPIGRVTAAGNSTRLQQYGLTDPQPFAGFTYYRLKQVDANGGFVYSPIRSVLFDAAATPLKGYPVPVVTDLTIELPSAVRNQDVTLNFVNAAGVVVQQLRVSKDRLSDRKTIGLQFLPPGNYAVQMLSKTTTASLLFVKQ